MISPILRNSAVWGNERMRRIAWIGVVLAVLLMSVGPAADTAGAAANETATIVEAHDLTINEVQSIYNNASSGTFTLRFEGETTGALAYNSDAPTVELALETLTTLIDVAVTGAGTLGAPWMVTFLDPPKNVPLLIADNSGLGGATSFIAEEVTGLMIIDPAGIAYISATDELLISDSEINEEPAHYDGINLWHFTRSAPLVLNSTGLTPEPGTLAKKEPTGLAYNPSNGHVWMTNDLTRSGTGELYIYDIGPGADGNFGTGDDSVAATSLAPFGLVPGTPPDGDDIEDVAYDWAGTLGNATDDSLFIANGANAEVLRIELGANGTLDASDTLTVIDAAGADIHDAEGIAYRASSDTILVIESGPNDDIHEMTKDGQLLRTIDISILNRPGINLKPADVTLAPASDGSSATHMYVVDRGDDNTVTDPDGNVPPEDGMLYELSAPFDNLAPVVAAGPDLVAGVAETPIVTATVYDDGQPNPVAPAVTWSQVSGPGTVTFGSPTALTTNMSFSTVGVYVVKIVADDGALTAEDSLQITVIPGAPVNQPPIVLAGADQAVTLPAAAVLIGQAQDADMLPNPPGAITTTWSKVSGPGTVTFGDASALTTNASFSATGTYVLRLTADDSDLTASDDLTVTVEPGPTISFDDIDGSIFKDDIIWLAENGITLGCNAEGTLFCPNDSVTRAQMASFLVRAYNLPAVAGNRFGDVSGTHLANINALAEAGITLGCNAEGTLFCPSDSVTRAQMGSFLARAGGLAPIAGDVFVDVAGVHEGNINAIADAGITLGCDTVGPLYCPNDTVTRGQMAAFLHRALG